ncbi:hypothetical protein BH18ACT2_BH18ACT2_10080 [soil metagenome]
MIGRSARPRTSHEAIADVVIRFMRTLSFLVRFVDLTGDP